MTPSSPRMDQVDPRLDLYIDGLLNGEELAVFERDLSRSPALQAAVKAQSRIDDGLREMYSYDAGRSAAPEPPAVIGRVEAETSATARTLVVSARTRWFALAAVLLLGAAVLSTYIQNRFTTPRVVGPEMVYSTVDKPEFVCKDDAEFAAAVKKRLGQPLVLAAAPGIEALGWAYGDNYAGDIVGSDTMVLINRVRGEKVLVFMDKLRDDRALSVTPESGLKIFRRENGSLVLYEVTPLEEPEVITRLRNPEAPR